MKNVLVIDDEEAVAHAIRRALEQAGHRATIVTSASEGLHHLREQGADVVVTDLLMPGLDGVDTIRALREEFPWVRVVAVSGGGASPEAPSPGGLTTQACLAVARKAGAHATLAKPFEARDLLLALKGSVLVVDDEPAVRQALVRVLESAGYAVRVAPNGVDAVAALREEPADIVITDIIMPQLNGVETIRTIARDHPQTRIVAISGGGSYGMGAYKPNTVTTTAYLAAAQDAGAHAVLTKPFERRDILAAIGHPAEPG